MLVAPQRVERLGRAAFGDVDGRVVVGRDDIAHIAETAGDDVEDGIGGRKRGVLDEPRCAQPRLTPNRASVGLELA